MNDTDEGFLTVGQRAEENAKERDKQQRLQREREEKYQREMAAILEQLPEELRSFVSWQAWDTGHSAGYNEVVLIASNLTEGLLPAVKAYTERLKGQPLERKTNESLEAWKKRVCEEAAESTKSKYVNADMHVEAYMRLREGLLKILDLHPLHDGYFHEGSSTGPRACKMEDIDEYVLEKIKERLA